MNLYTLRKTAAFLGLSLALFVLYRYSPLGGYLNLEYLQLKSYYFKEFVKSHYWLSVAAYMAFFIVTIALSIPSSLVLTLLGGYLFGTFAATAYAVVSVALGVGISFMVFRFFLQDSLRITYKEQAERFERAMQEHGASYLLMLHFSALFPYAVMNSLAAVARVPFATVLWTTIVGFLPQAFVLAYAGKGFATLRSVNDLFSKEIIIAGILLMLLAFLPIALKHIQRRSS